MSIAYAESFVTDPESPFIDGENLRYFDRETGWRITAEPDGFTFTCTKPDDFRYFSSHRQEAQWLVKSCPAASELYSAGKTAEGFQTLRIPTLERANAFAAERFAGLPVAGIQAFQESDLGNTTAPGYLRDLSAGPDFRLPVSRGHERHLHDIIGHFLGAATVDEKSFAVFRALAEDARSLWAKGPQWPPILYVEGLAKAFDQFTDNQLNRAMRGYVGDDGYLISQSLYWVELKQRAMLPRAIEIVQSFGIDVVPTRGRYSVSVPWETENLPAYYEQIAARLR